jgi:alpha-glucosidase (family GH31 glycosyl hydrolase)
VTEANKNEVEVYFPPYTSWIDFYSLKVVADNNVVNIDKNKKNNNKNNNGKKIVVDAPLSKIPVFIKNGFSYLPVRKTCFSSVFK